MIFQGFEDTSVTPASLGNKIKTLLNTYKTSKDNASRTGASPCFAPYAEELEELFGRQPIISNPHSHNVGIRGRSALENEIRKTTQSTNGPSGRSASSAVSVLCQLFNNTTTPTIPPSVSQQMTEISNDERFAPDQSTHSTSPLSAPSTSRHSEKVASRSKQTAKDRYLEMKLRLKKESMEHRERMYQQYLETKLELLQQRNEAFVDSIEVPNRE